METLTHFRRYALARLREVDFEVKLINVRAGLYETGETSFEMFAYIDSKLCIGRASNQADAVTRCIESKAQYARVAEMHLLDYLHVPLQRLPYEFAVN